MLPKSSTKSYCQRKQKKRKENLPIKEVHNKEKRQSLNIKKGEKYIEKTTYQMIFKTLKRNDSLVQGAQQIQSPLINTNFRTYSPIQKRGRALKRDLTKCIGKERFQN